MLRVTHKLGPLSAGREGGSGDVGGGGGLDNGRYRVQWEDRE